MHTSNFRQRLVLKFETKPWTNHPRLTKIPAPDGDPGSDIINEELILQTIDGENSDRIANHFIRALCHFLPPSSAGISANPGCNVRYGRHSIIRM